MFEKKFILGVGINTVPENLILEYIVKSVKNSSEKYYIVTPNPELLIIAQRDIGYKKVLNGARLALSDGVGIVLASKLLKKGIHQRITGVDLVNKLCKAVAEKPITVGFLGGKPGIADKTAKCLTQKHPGLKVVFVSENWESAEVAHKNFPVHNAGKFDLKDNKAEGANAHSKNFVSSPHQKIISHLSIDILFVAFGSPKQELWISDNLNRLPVKVAIGVGGAFDFISGEIRRAPAWIRNIGLEWLFRLLLQPWRIKRQLSLIYFIFLVLKEKFIKTKMI